MKKKKKKIIVPEKHYDFGGHDYLMNNNGFTCGFNMPLALSGEQAFSLPPFCKRSSFLVDKYPACPKDWLRSEGKVKSYFVPVIEDRGMWLDFNNNDSHTHHVAIVVSIQGINPITGLPCKDAYLEQYIEECPKQKIKFGPDRYCKKCDYKWPKQNYLCTTGTLNGYLWLDGFRAVNGFVRQYILTAEKMRGVASNIIGKDRVYAIGVSFFVSKEKRPPRPQSVLRVGVSSPMSWTTDNNSGKISNYMMSSFSLDYTPPENTLYYADVKCDSIINTSSDGNVKGLGGVVSCSGLTPNSFGEQFKQCAIPTGALKSKASYKCGKTLGSRGGLISPTVQTKKLEVGAGAKINQEIYDDPEKLEFWHDEPEAIICVSYCTEEDAKKILSKGAIDIEGSAEGFLQKVPVGN